MAEPEHSILPDGTQEWRLNGVVLHRENGPAVIRADGAQYWFWHGRLHRLNGPAYIHPDGTQEWYVESKMHRLDGPAAIWPNGTQEWYVEDVQIDFDIVEFFRDLGVEDADDETKMAVLKLKFPDNFD